MVNANYKYSLQITGNKIVEWHFDNILLPDSNVNEPASHGSIVYRIKPKPSLQIGNIVRNKASIYFDYNTAVITNEEKTVVVPNMPEIPSVTGMENLYCANQGVQKGKIVNLPSDGPGVTTATVRLDNNNITMEADSSFSFNVGILQAGMHTVEVTFSNISGTRTAALQFSVTAAQTPKVNISASNNYITNLANPVILTATSAGGGQNPMYTFARDRGFSSLIQPEGYNAIVEIQPSSLSIGDNMIYVKVKTSADCYTKQTDTNNILLKRDAATGIVDLDNPGQIITLTPNPFDSKITIKGMSNSKAYGIVLNDGHGKSLYIGEVKNRQLCECVIKDIAPGINFLSIYESKKRRIGTEKMIKLR
jgi:hypothetical protein